MSTTVSLSRARFMKAFETIVAFHEGRYNQHRQQKGNSLAQAVQVLRTALQENAEPTPLEILLWSKLAKARGGLMSASMCLNEGDVLSEKTKEDAQTVLKETSWSPPPEAAHRFDEFIFEPPET